MCVDPSDILSIDLKENIGIEPFEINSNAGSILRDQNVRVKDPYRIITFSRLCCIKSRLKSRRASNPSALIGITLC